MTQNGAVERETAVLNLLTAIDDYSEEIARTDAERATRVAHNLIYALQQLGVADAEIRWAYQNLTGRRIK